MSKFLHYNLNQILQFGNISEVSIQSLIQVNAKDSLNDSLFNFTLNIDLVSNKEQKNLAMLLPSEYRCVYSNVTQLNNVIVNDLKSVFQYIKLPVYIKDKAITDIKIIDYINEPNPKLWQLLYFIYGKNNTFKLGHYKTFCFFIKDKLIILENERFYNRIDEDLKYKFPYDKNFNQLKNQIEIDIIKKVFSDPETQIIKDKYLSTIVYKDLTYHSTKSLTNNFDLIIETIIENNYLDLI